MSLQSTDQVADLITRIRNAALVGKNEVYVPTSKLKLAVAEGLVKAKFLTAVEVQDGEPRGTLHVTINNPGEVCKINEIKKISKPGRRVYTGATEIPKIKSGRGMVLMSTSKGIMSGEEARKNRLGGEILVQVW